MKKLMTIIGLSFFSAMMLCFSQNIETTNNKVQPFKVIKEKNFNQNTKLKKASSTLQLENWTPIGKENFATGDRSILQIDSNGTEYIAFSDADNNQVSVMKYDIFSFIKQWIYVGNPKIIKNVKDWDFKIINNIPYLAYVDNQGVAKVLKFTNTWVEIGSQSLAQYNGVRNVKISDNNGTIYILFKLYDDDGEKLYLLSYDDTKQTWKYCEQQSRYLQEISLEIRYFDIKFNNNKMYVSIYTADGFGYLVVYDFSQNTWLRREGEVYGLLFDVTKEDIIYLAYIDDRDDKIHVCQIIGEEDSKEIYLEKFFQDGEMPDLVSLCVSDNNNCYFSHPYMDSYIKENRIVSYNNFDRTTKKIGSESSIYIFSPSLTTYKNLPYYSRSLDHKLSVYRYNGRP